MKIELSIFTNCTRSAPKIEIIKKTYLSFINTFGKIPFKIYLDPNPKTQAYEEYKKNLECWFGSEIITTSSLSDGYIKSIKESEADYLFQLEHDWIFKNITHSLSDILDAMSEAKIYHFRFSKHPNTITPELMKWQTIMIKKESNGIKYCETDNLSNNPHIIDRKFYLKNLLDRICLLPGSSGIEENLTKKGLIGCQYGGLDYPPTIQHLDGKRSL
jgi:hypothetical protein